MTEQPPPSPWFCLGVLIIIIAVTVMVGLALRWALWLR